MESGNSWLICNLLSISRTHIFMSSICYALKYIIFHIRYKIMDRWRLFYWNGNSRRAGFHDPCGFVTDCTHTCHYSVCRLTQLPYCTCVYAEPPTRKMFHDYVSNNMETQTNRACISMNTSFRKAWRPNEAVTERSNHRADTRWLKKSLRQKYNYHPDRIR